MKGLTLWQPWASLVAIGAKTIETRSWMTRYRGPLAIHAALSFPRDAVRACHSEPFADVLRPHYRYPAMLPRGAIVAVVELVDVVRTSGAPFDPLPGYAVSDADLAFGDFGPGRYGWVLAGRQEHFGDPRPCKGALGLWDVPASVFA